MTKDETFLNRSSTAVECFVQMGLCKKCNQIFGRTNRCLTSIFSYIIIGIHSSYQSGTLTIGFYFHLLVTEQYKKIYS